VHCISRGFENSPSVTPRDSGGSLVGPVQSSLSPLLPSYKGPGRPVWRVLGLVCAAGLGARLSADDILNTLGSIPATTANIVCFGSPNPGCQGINILEPSGPQFTLSEAMTITGIGAFLEGASPSTAAPSVVQIRPSLGGGPDPNRIAATVSGFTGYPGGSSVFYESASPNIPLPAGSYFALFASNPGAFACCPGTGGVTFFEGSAFNMPGSITLGFILISAGTEQGLIFDRGSGPITAAFLITGSALSSQVLFAPPPTVTSVTNAFGDSLLHGGDFGPMIAPNTWVKITGSNLSPAGDARIWQNADFVNGQMPTQLDGVSVTVNGTSAYVYYISPTQVNILTPPGAIQGPVQVQLNNGIAGYTMSVGSQPLSPSFFVFDGAHVVGTHLNGTDIGPTTLYPGLTTPAQPGEEVVLYANGFGPSSVPVVSGSPMQSGSLPVLPVVTIGGLNANVLFAGLVGPGEFQFNVIVPPSAPDGDQPLTATYNGFETQAGVVITVQH
jgi:uncharacterized protein (TIGR03437 family)